MTRVKIIPRGLYSVMRDLDRFAKAQHKYNVDTVKLTTRGMLNALSGSTRVAPKKREIREVELTAQNGGTFRAWQVERWRNGRQAWQTIMRDNGGHWPKSAAQAKSAGAVRITNRGLAKKSWWIISRALGVTGTANQNVNQKASTIAAMAVQESKKDLNALDPYIRIVNALSYIYSAFFQSGDHTLASLEHRAGRWIEEYAKRQVEKNMQRCAL